MIAFNTENTSYVSGLPTRSYFIMAYSLGTDGYSGSFALTAFIKIANDKNSAGIIYTFQKDDTNTIAVTVSNGSMQISFSNTRYVVGRLIHLYN